MLIIAAVSPDTVTPGLLGFTVFALLGLALFLLIRSMNKHLRRVNVPDDARKNGDEKERGTGTSRP